MDTSDRYETIKYEKSKLQKLSHAICDWPMDIHSGWHWTFKIVWIPVMIFWTIIIFPIFLVLFFLQLSIDMMRDYLES